MPELLSPAGGPEALAAALKSGADAVYLGLRDFSARAGADNFSSEEYLDALAECGKLGVKVYVTLNTLLTDRQLPEMERTLRFLAVHGCDGIIVQDLATAALARQIAPDLPLHGSTQMCIYNLEGAKLLESMGFIRAVVARELSAEEVAYIVQNTALEVEVFVHGALCMCYSGHCYFSSVVGRNSGNRGRCAQPCRLPYEGGYPLSLKDLSLLPRLQELVETGVHSLKIEGRLKSPEYVGGVTAAFADALRGKAPDESTMKQLEDLFSRDGFTDGYWTGRTGSQMFGIKTPTAFQDYKAAVHTLTRRKPVKRFDLSVRLEASAVNPCRWTFSDGKHTVTLTGQAAQPAQNKPLDQESLFERLDKLQDTPYTLTQCVLIAEGDLFLPVSRINEMRRSGLEALDNARAKRVALVPAEADYTVPRVASCGGTQVLYHSPRSFSPALDHSAFEAVWLRPEDIALYNGANRGVHVDHFYPADKLLSLLKELKEKGIRRLLLGNLGHILPAQELGFEIWGDYSLNITNSLSLYELRKLGLRNATLSFELSLPQIRDLKRSMPVTLLVYGRLPLMQFKNCILKNKGQCQNHNGFATLTDRKGQTFLLACRPGCGNTLFNSLPLLLESVDMQSFPDIDKRFCFTDESPEQVAAILQQYAQSRRPDGQFTGGLYKRGVI
ncbi:MAG: U32 family peptidase [Clostridia bacterium]|nr:U32 family peptidase [Clostridia bacterium]